MDEENKIFTNGNSSEVQRAVRDEVLGYMSPKIGGGVNQINNANTINNTNPVSIPNQFESRRPIIRTYKSDVEETVQANHISSINIAIAENKKMMEATQGKNDEEAKKSKLSKNLIIFSIILVVGGALALGIPYFLVQKQNQTPVVTETVASKSLFTADVEEKINIQDLNLNRVATTLNERVNQSAISLGQIKNIYLTSGQGTLEKLITAKDFLNLIKANVPNEIELTLKDNYMFGMHNYNGNQEFLVLKVGDYDTTFSGMLSWENYLWNDFTDLFNLQNNAQATTTTQFGITIKKFQDAVFSNKDCRVVKDSNGNIVFLYSIIDPNTVVITTSVDTLKEIISRVNKARVVTQ